VLGAVRADVVPTYHRHVERAIAVRIADLGLIEDVAAPASLNRIRSRRTVEVPDAAVDVDRRIRVLRRPGRRIGI